jgi:aldose 1-epimerase
LEGFGPGELFTLSSGSLTAKVCPFGATLLELRTPDRSGKVDNIILSYASLAEYQAGRQFLGGVVGRYANRIARARFSLDGVEYRLEPNEGEHQLHGGSPGFHKVWWRVIDARASALELEYVSNDGEAGFPGELTARTVYELSESSLKVEFTATTTRPTVVNLAPHPYFNLTGHGQVLDHDLQILAESYLPVDSSSIPLGPAARVAETPFDFRMPKRIGQDIEAAQSYDHNYILRPGGVAARLWCPASGRVMELKTTEPGLQFYSGQHLEKPYTGLCLEPQHFPDSPNRPEYPDTILRPGGTYRSAMIFEFHIA